jgi:hypothetical protein
MRFDRRLINSERKAKASRRSLAIPVCDSGRMTTFERIAKKDPRPEEPAKRASRRTFQKAPVAKKEAYMRGF